MPRRRVNLSVSPETYESLEALRRAARLQNVCQVVAAMIGAFVEISRRAGRFPDAETIEDEVHGMFAEMDGYDKTPQAGHAPVRHPHRTIR